jgi:WD40 repeat protein
MLQNHSGGLTHLIFSNDGNYLFSGGRKDPDIYCWDMRNPGRILQVYKRDVKTNQRMYFDLDSQLRYLSSGNNNGDVTIWKADNFESKIEFDNTLLKFHAHDDCVNGIRY